MKKFLTLSAIMLAMLGCKKDKDGGTKPVLTFKSASATDIPKELQEYYLYFNVKDGDGDLEGTWNVVDLYHFPDTTKYDQMPLPKLETHKGVKLDAEMILIMSDVREGNFLPAHWPSPATVPDTSQLKIFVVDNAGNSSDTITLPKIVIRN
ncbi:hypothetical protein [Chitinophaga deserti]|uniref:hypothetical protein n=1 Tax=Chitinophaga deserti TaxID=2164099 RepID=UPI000D6C9B9E|nr:hypothetical protein [Chitinophaga deserti]